MQQNRSEFQNFPRGAIPWTPSVGRLAHSAATVPIWPPGKHLPTLLGVGSVLVGQPRSIVIIISAESMYNCVLYIAGTLKLGYAMVPGVNGDIKNSC